ncbi:MAG: B-4DMT family transporter [Gordonia sp. (in: high G+C Gram-positive bacteria)]|uniref:B-4DMT family transporter n=1 Tax=Gordonia sp. (in: high G+C Gram-positive bacteria) TaxID=84139 RepID=UPI0039E3D6F6
MISWLLRGLSMGAIVTTAWVLVGVFMKASATTGSLWKVLAVALIVLLALLWGGLDGIRDARANPDPDDYADLTMVWLKAGFLAAAIAVVIGYIVGNTILPQMGPRPLFVALTAGISFLTLLVYVPAFVGVSVGRWLIRREDKRADSWADDEAETVDEAVEDADYSAATAE